MNSTLIELFSIVFRSSLYLALAATVVLLLTRKLAIRSARLQRIAWGIVLLQGCWLFAFAYHFSVDTQWLKAVGVQPMDMALASQPSSLPRSEVASNEHPTVPTANTVPNDLSSVISRGEAANDPLPASTSLAASSSLRTGLSPSEPETGELPNSISGEASISPSKDVTQSATTDQLPSASPFLSEIRVVLMYAYINTIASAPILWAALAWCWAIGGLFLLIRGFFFWSIFQLSLRQSVPARPEWEAQWKRLLQNHMPNASLRILEHDTLGPMLAMTPRGLAVVVPSDFWEERTEEQRAGILLHELAHYERGDVWWSLFARLIVWPQWFNPMAWVALKKFDECAEWSCDESLCKSDQVIVTEYAKALVAMVEFPKGAPFAARAASGSSLSHRITRILLPSSRESRASRAWFAAMLVGVVSVGLLRFEFSETAQANEVAELIENESVEPSAMVSAGSAIEDEDAVLSFIKSLDDTNDSTGYVAKLKQALVAEAGKVVLASRAAQEENNLREQMAQDPTPLYVSEYFEKKGERYALRADRASYADRFIREWKLFEKNVEAMRPGLKAYADRITPDTEATKLLLRFLNDESASTLIYMEQIQPRLEPDYRTVRERFDEKFVLDRDKKLIIRAGGRAVAESELRMFDKASKIANRIRPESQEWGRDLSKVHPLSQEIAKALVDPLNAAYVAMDNLNDDYSIDQKVEGYFDAIESMFVDKAEGLEPNEEREAELREGLKKYNALRKFAEKIRPHLATIASEINDSEPLAAAWKKALSTDIVLVWMANTMEPTDSDPATAVQEFLDQWLVADDKGKLKVSPDQEEEVLNTLREWLRQGRMMRRRGNEMTAFASKLDHPELAKAYQTFSGKCLILRSVRDLAARQYFDGLGAWIESHFDITDDGARLKEGHEYEIMNLLEQVENVKKELAKDDF